MMHIEGPWLSTTSTKKRAERTTKAEREELERQWRERNVRLKKMGLAKESFEQFLEFVYGRPKKVARQEAKQSKVSTSYAKTHQERKGSAGTTSRNKAKDGQCNSDSRSAEVESNMAPKSLGSWITGPCSSKPSPTYSGSAIKGIGAMHKSNLVPIFSDQEAIDISKMRR